MLWQDVDKGHVFRDDSECLRRFETSLCDTYTLTYRSGVYKGSKRTFTASVDHFLLCDTSKCSKEAKEKINLLIKSSFIPKTLDIHVSLESGIYEKTCATETRDVVAGIRSFVWLNMREIHGLLSQREKVRIVSDFKKRKRVLPFSSAYTGKKECFCITTDTGRYEVCELVNHNSVALRNVVFHSLTHSDDIKLALIDLKRSEFEYLKGTNGIVGVGNTPREAAEILRLARDIMYKRNEENAKRGLTNFADWQPQQPTDKIKIFNTEFPEDTSFDVEIAGEKKKMTAKEILQYIN